MNRVNVDYDKKQIISNVFRLTNVATDESLEFIPSDSEGNFNYRGISMTPIMRNAMQTTQTAGEWTDLEYPWMAIPQEDWTGGRANLRFTIDKSRYYDSYRAQSAFNSVIFNAPLDYYSTGYRKAVTNWPGDVHWKELRNKVYTASIIPEQNILVHNIYLLLKRRGTPDDVLKVRIYKTSDETVTSDEIEISVSEVDIISKFHRVSLETDFAMTAGTNYTLEVSCESGTMRDHYEIGMTGTTLIAEPYYRLTEEETDKQAKFFTYEQLQFMVRQEPNGTPALWMNGDIGLVTSAATKSLTSSGKSWTSHQWKGARIGLVYRNGIEGQVTVWKTITDNNSGTISIDSPWDVVPQEDTAFIIVDTPIWTEITGHGLTHAVTDVHVIRGTVYFAQGDYTVARKMRWDMATGNFEFASMTYSVVGPDSEVIDASVRATFFQSVRDTSGMMLYYAKNDGDGHRRCIYRSHLVDWKSLDSKYYWYYSGTLQESSKAKIMTNHAYIDDQTEMEFIIDFGAGDVDFSGYQVTIAAANWSSSDNSGKLALTLQESYNGMSWEDVTTYTCQNGGIHIFYAHCKYRYRRIKAVFTGTGSAKDFGVSIIDTLYKEDVIPVLDNYGKITRLFEYGAEQEKSLWVFQEGMVSSINKTGETYHIDRINIDELITTAEEWNGKAVATSDVYLMWSWLNGLQRYYNTQLEGKGPDHDEGLSHNMRGRITQILSYPSNFFASVDGGEDGYSSVFLFNGSGWHNLYTASNPGERIFDIAFQPIYGNRPDRLWIQLGSDIIWLAMPSKILYAPQDPHAEYTHESVLTSAWITGGMAEVKKLWQSLSIMADNLEPGVCWIEADYQLDNDDHPWMPIPTNPYETSPQEEKLLASSNESVNGYKLRYRLRLQTSDHTKTPKVNVVLLKAIGIIEIKYSIGFTARNIKYKPDLMGEYEELEPLEVFTVLDDWARNLYTLRLNSAYRLFDNRKVFLEAPQTSVLNEKSEGYLQQITMTEI